MKNKPRLRMIAGMWAYCIEADGYFQHYMGNTPNEAFQTWVSRC